MVMVAAVASLTLAMFIMAGFYVGLWSNQRDEAQNQADAISIAAMEIARTQGVDAVCRHPVIQEMMRQNGNQAGRMDDCGRFVEVANGDGTTSLRFVVGTSTVMDTGNEPLLREMMGGERFTLRSRATAGVTQEAFDDAERRLPKFVMVLDYSGSMGVDFGGRSRLSALVRAVNGMLDLGLVVTAGAAIFDVPLRGSLFLLAFAGALYLLTTLGLGLLVATLAKNQQQAFMAAFFIILPMVLLSGFMSPVPNMPEWLQYATLLDPVRHFVEILRAVLLKGATFTDIAPQLTALAGIGTVLFASAIRSLHRSLA